MIYSEKYLEKKLKREVEKIGGLCFKLSSQHQRGLPDRLCIINGNVYFAEIKTTGKKLSLIQEAIHKKIRNRGGDVSIIDDKDTLDAFIKKIL